MIEGILFSQMTVKLSEDAALKQEGIFAIIMVIFLFHTVYMFFQTMKSCSRLLTHPLLRVTAVTGKKYVFSMLIFFNIVMVFWYAISGILFYVGYLVAIPTTYVYTEAKAIMQDGMLHNLIYTISDLFEISFSILQILLVIILVKLFTRRKKIQNILIVIIFLVVNIMLTFISTLLGRLAPTFEGLRRTIYTDENADNTLFFSIFTENGFNLLNVSFIVIVSIVLFYLIAYIIDRKLEV